STEQIYTDWANHYLAKSGCSRLIKDLSQDITDGVLLAQIIQIIVSGVPSDNQALKTLFSGLTASITAGVC
ncbi:Neuron navigator 3, partial [Ilyodon furcidens]